MEPPSIVPKGADSKKTNLFLSADIVGDDQNIGIGRERCPLMPAQLFGRHSDDVPRAVLSGDHTNRHGLFAVRFMELKIDKPDFSETINRHRYTSPRSWRRAGWSMESMYAFRNASFSRSRSEICGHSGSGRSTLGT